MGLGRRGGSVASWRDGRVGEIVVVMVVRERGSSLTYLTYLPTCKRGVNLQREAELSLTLPRNFDHVFVVWMCVW